ncbi:MAG: hypothetical protein LQ352_006452 [Teloschistes flavicans]|nr:MAG: hypothetical protein LQ352_006452 [Teloschistes flavicans]
MKSWSKTVSAKFRSTKQVSSAGPTASEAQKPEWSTSSSESALQPRINARPTLLERLPVEIRLQIWEEVLGGNLFHLNGSKHPIILECYLCRNFAKDTSTNNDPTHRMYSRCQGSQKEPCFFSRPERASYRPLSVLLTCRQIYSEAVDVLYGANTFNIDTGDTVNAFVNVTGTRSLKVQTVHVNMAMWRIHYQEIPRTIESRHAFHAWRLSWSDLGDAFKGLQHLRLDIFGTSSTELSQSDLQPLLVLPMLKSFDLVVWRDSNQPDSTGQDLALSAPLQMYIRQTLCKKSP